MLQVIVRIVKVMSLDEVGMLYKLYFMNNDNGKIS
jgi:hypothetical protein